jgi:hypothetical protein
VRDKSTIVEYPMTESDTKREKGGPMTRKLLMTAAVVAIALMPSIGIGTVEVHSGGSGSGGFHGGGFAGGGFGDRGSFGGRGFRGDEFRGDDFGYGGYFGGYYPGYYGYGRCYLTVFGTTYCY